MKVYDSRPALLSKWLRNRKVARHRPKIWCLPEQNLGYIKITKVASTSIEHCLTAFLHSQSNGDDTSTPDRNMVKHYSRIYARHEDLNKLKPSERPGFTFAFVRNPLDRLYSSYTDKIVDVRNAGQSKNIFWNLDITLDMSFEEFVERVAEISDQKIDRHLRSQSAFVCTNNKVIVDYIGHFENMNEDWQVLVDKFGLPSLPHRNKSTKSSGKSPYSKRTAEMAAERYIHDLENFGYAEEVNQLIESL
jgi:hypothetical protein